MSAFGSLLGKNTVARRLVLLLVVAALIPIGTLSILAIGAWTFRRLSPRFATVV